VAELHVSNVQTRAAIADDIRRLGVAEGDVVLVRAALGAVGRVSGGAKAVVDGLLDAVGPAGTIVSLAFTETAFIRKPDPAKPFTENSPTYAGALPKAMLAHEGRFRSQHPSCSFVAIGARAREIVDGHGPEAGAYEPVRTMMAMGSKGILIGCVDASPGFTTAHLAEADLRLFRRVIFPWLNKVYYVDQDQSVKLFTRMDHGLCSQGFRNFYSHYVRKGLLRSGLVGDAYSIAVPLTEAYQIERALLSENPKFAICGDPRCVMCNARRWDRVHRIPGWILRRFTRSARSAT
jgi:aminoglycoside N3'-acetyltransferase